MDKLYKILSLCVFSAHLGYAADELQSNYNVPIARVFNLDQTEPRITPLTLRRILDTHGHTQNFLPTGNNVSEFLWHAANFPDILTRVINLCEQGRIPSPTTLDAFTSATSYGNLKSSRILRVFFTRQGLSDDVLRDELNTYLSDSEEGIEAHHNNPQVLDPQALEKINSEIANVHTMMEFLFS